MMKNNEKRIVWVDLLRIIATWGVISIHGKSCYEFETGTLKWFEANVIGFAFTFCVPVFLMLSGYLSLKRELSIRDTLKQRVFKAGLMKILSLVLCALTGVIIALIKNERIIDWLNNTRGWGFGSSYFAVLAGCYLVSPFIYLFIKDVKYEKYFLILSFIFCFIVPPFSDLDYVKSAVPNWLTAVMNWIDYGQVYIPVGSVSLFVLGHYLGKISDKISKKFAVSFFAISFIAWELSGFNALTNNNIIVSVLRYGRYYGSYVSPLITMYASSVFLLFKVVISDIHLSDKLENTVRHIGKNSIIIFLLHGIVISVLRPYIPVFWIKSFTIETIVDVTIYFIIALLISLILEHIPVFKKIM